MRHSVPERHHEDADDQGNNDQSLSEHRVQRLHLLSEELSLKRAFFGFF